MKVRRFSTRCATRRRAAALAAASLVALPAVVHGGAVTDTSWGRTPQAFTGSFTIPESVGRRAGTNLFHSFTRFGIDAGESATFTTTTAALSNVIARVTGTEPSALFGVLRLSGASGSAPNLFLINPNGITFGPGARANVPAAFHASTAHELRFADGTVFAAGRGADSTLSVAAPAAFGFLGGAAAQPIHFLPNARLNNFLDNRDVDLTAGAIEMDSATAHTETGVLRLLATGAEAVAVPVDPRASPPWAALGGRLSLRGSIVDTAEGHIALQAGTIELLPGPTDNISFVGAEPQRAAAGAIDVFARDRLQVRDSFIASTMAFDDPAGGPALRIRSLGPIVIEGFGGGIETTTRTASPAGAITVSAPALTMSGATDIASFTRAPGSSGSVTVEVKGAMRLVDGASIFSDATPAFFDAPDVSDIGAAGPVRVSAATLTLDGTGWSNPPTIASASRFVAAPAGAVTVTVDGALVLRGGGNINSSAYAHPDFAPFATQRAGSVLVSADTLLIDASPDDQAITGIYSDSLGAGGPAGQVRVQARELAILGGIGDISADNSGPGAGGSVLVVADRIVLDGRDQGAASISSTSAGAGDGGTVTVQVADTLTLQRGGLIEARAQDAGRGGSVTIDARRLHVEGSGPEGLVTGILGTSSGTGAAGRLTVRVAERLALVRGGVIAASAAAAGPSGAIRVEVGELSIDGQGDPLTGIRSRALPASSGQVGRIEVVARGQVMLRDAPEALTIRNDALAPDLARLSPQSITLEAERLRLDGAAILASSAGAAPGSAIVLRLRDSVTLSNGARIRTSAQDGNGGPIDVAADGHVRLVDAQIESSVLGALNGNGGNIAIRSPVLVLDNGSVQANTEAARATGGDLGIAVRALVTSGSALTVGGSSVVRFDPLGPGANVVQAAAPDGVSGNVTVGSPALDLSGSLRALEAQLIDIGALGRDVCGIGYGSSLVRVGRGGLPPSSADAQRPRR
jgi:filamentous hemagglutinin family protein